MNEDATAVPIGFKHHLLSISESTLTLVTFI